MQNSGWEKATRNQNDRFKNGATRPQEAGTGDWRQDLQTLRNLLPQLDPRFKFGAVAVVLAFLSLLLLIFER